MLILDNLGISACCKTDSDMMIDTKPLTVLSPSPTIRPVGISPAVTVGGKIATQTQGRGLGIFSDVVNAAAILYSTAKGPTAGVGTAPAMLTGTQTGSGNFESDGQASASNNSRFILWAFVLLVVGKLFKLF